MSSIRETDITRMVIGTSRTVGSAKKFVRITSGFGGGEFTKTLRKVCNSNDSYSVNRFRVVQQDSLLTKSL
jgi:hypothetical protein